MVSNKLKSTICKTFTFNLNYGPFNFFSHIFVQSVQHNAFEGLQAEECGILNGCENGRCVRVQEGYTCDCFDGYELDLSKMACVGKLVGHVRLSLLFPVE